MLKLRTALSKLKCRILGINYNKQYNSANPHHQLLELVIDGRTSIISRTEFHQSLGKYNYGELLNLKERALN